MTPYLSLGIGACTCVYQNSVVTVEMQIWPEVIY